MDFKAKLNQLIQELEFTNSHVAHHSGLDASLISRFKHGKRTPYIGSPQIQSLCRGLVHLAKEQDKIEELCNYCGFPICEMPAIPHLLEKWFSDEDSGLRVKSSTRKRYNNSNPKLEFFSFAKKMDALMGAFEVNNITLAKKMHVDPSLVSRFRTGSRKPVGGNWFPYEFCHYMAKLIFTFPPHIRTKRLSCLFENPTVDTIEQLSHCLLGWMHTPLSSSPPVPGIPSELIELLKSHPTSSKSSQIFTGIEGLRKATKYFLTLLAVQPEPYTLYLYSDQPMEWISEDPDFFNLWKSLMYTILKQKNRIYIIHNINRPLSEMLEALKGWIPLYMTGLIEPFFFEKEKENLFNQTMFIAPNICTINAAFVAGTENQAKYLFSTHTSQVKYHYEQFHALMENSKPLLQTFTCDHLNQYAKYISPIDICKGDSTYLFPTFSMATMPEQLFKQIISRSMLDEDKKNFAREYRQNCIKAFNFSLHNAKVSEIILIPKTTDLDENKIRIDLPTLNLFYSKEELSQHVQHIIDLLNTNKSYYLFPLYETPFGNINLSLFGESQVLIMKTDQPLTMFLFENTLMQQVFSKYLDTLTKSLDPYPREKVIAQLNDV